MADHVVDARFPLSSAQQIRGASIGNDYRAVTVYHVLDGDGRWWGDAVERRVALAAADELHGAVEFQAFDAASRAVGRIYRYGDYLWCWRCGEKLRAAGTRVGGRLHHVACAAACSGPEATADDLIADVLAGLRVLRDRPQPLSDASLEERARNIVAALLGSHRVTRIEDERAAEVAA